MQIFMPYKEPKKSAMALDDLRLNKQVTECGQIASTGFWINSCELGENLTAMGKACLPSHENHPLCKWAGLHPHNMYRVIHFGIICAEEKNLRYPLNPFHKMFKKLYYLSGCTSCMEHKGKPSYWLNATTNHKHVEDVHTAYQLELNLKWCSDKKRPHWGGRVVPSFFLS